MAADDVPALGVVDITADITGRNADGAAEGQQEVGIVLADPLGLGEEFLGIRADMRRPGYVTAGGMDVVHEPDDHREHVTAVFFDVHGRPPDRRRDAHGPVGKEIGLETFDHVFGPHRRQRDVGRDGRNRRRQGLDHAGNVDHELFVGFLDLEQVDRVAVEVRIAAHPDGGQHPHQVQAELLAQVGERGDAEFVGVVADGQGVTVFGAVEDAELHGRGAPYCCCCCCCSRCQSESDSGRVPRGKWRSTSPGRST